MARVPSEGFPWAEQGLQGVFWAERGFLMNGNEWLGLDPGLRTGQGLWGAGAVPGLGGLLSVQNPRVRIWDSILDHTIAPALLKICALNSNFFFLLSFMFSIHSSISPSIHLFI